MQNTFAILEMERKKMEVNIQTALALEGLIQTKIDEYSDILKA